MNAGYLLGTGLALGFSLVIPPGPMNALIAVRSVRSFRAGFTTGLGAMSADVVLGAVVYLVHSLVDLQPFVRWVDGIGAVVMGYFAVRILREPGEAAAPRDVRDVRVYSEALVVGLSNPFQILWWLTAGLASAYLGGFLLLAALFAAIAVWIVVFPLAVHHGARRSSRFPRAVALASGTLVAAFAAYFALLAAGLSL